MAATTQHTSPGGAVPQAGLSDPASTMAAPPEFCLKWNNYHESLADAFSTFLEGENFLDVSLACDDAVISAHKCVLSACSPLFQEILLKNPCSHPTIVLPGGVQAAHVHRLVAFIYHGEVTVPHHLLPDLIRTADLLKIRGLASESIIPLQQLPPQPLEVQAVITIPEHTGPPDLQEPAQPLPPPPELPAPPRRKRSRRDPSDTSPPPPELTAAEPPPPPLLCRGEPAVGMCPPQQQHHALNMQLPPQHHDAAANHHHRPGLPELSAAAAAAARLEPVVKQEVHPPDDHGAQGEEELSRSPAPQHQHHQLTTIDGLDLLDPSQLLGYDGSAGASTHRPCPVCNRIMRKRDLSRHMQRVHSSRKHACAHCPLSYGYRLDLRRHLQEKHPGMAGGDSPLSVAGSPSHRTGGDGDGSDYDERSDSNE